MDFRIEDVVAELEAVTRKATTILSESDAAQSQLQIQNTELKDEVQQLRAELEAAQRTTTTAREEPLASEEFLKEIPNQAKQFKILGVKLDKDHSEQIVALLTSYVEGKEPSQKLVKDNQELRRAIEKVKVENKGLINRLKAEESSKKQAKVLKESVEELESKCSKLQKELDSTEEELDLKTDQYSSLQTDNAGLKAMVPQIGALANTQEKLDGALRELDKYKLKCEELLPLTKTEERLTGALDKLEFYKRKCGQLEQEVEDLNGQAQIIKLHNAIAELKKSPLLQTGAAVRMRFLVQANKSKFKPPKRRAIIERGNDAAHRADGKADAALFHTGFLSISEDASAFEDVYRMSVRTCIAHRPRWQRALDLHAMMHTLKCDSASAKKYNEVAVKLDAIGSGRIEESDEAEDLLAALKREVDILVENDRCGNSSRNVYTTNVLSFLP
jgi:chromosome segregation ATPase